MDLGKSHSEHTRQESGELDTVLSLARTGPRTSDAAEDTLMPGVVLKRPAHGWRWQADIWSGLRYWLDQLLSEAQLAKDRSRAGALLKRLFFPPCELIVLPSSWSTQPTRFLDSPITTAFPAVRACLQP